MRHYGTKYNGSLLSITFYKAKKQKYKKKKKKTNKQIKTNNNTGVIFLYFLYSFKTPCDGVTLYENGITQT